MRTGKNISNIGYVSEEYFAARANDLRKSGVIGTCYWIAHQREVDENKNHLHILLLGGQKTYNTEGLSGLFGWDIDSEGNKGSLTARWTVTKDIKDWLSYGVHDPVYLLRKGLERKYSYAWGAIKCTEGDEDLLSRDILEARRDIEEGGDKVYKILRVAVKQGWSWERLLCMGVLPVGTLGNARVIYEIMAKSMIREGVDYGKEQGLLDLGQLK